MTRSELRTRLEGELERALKRAGATRASIASVMEAGCRLDGLGAAAVEPQLAHAEERLRTSIRALAEALDRLERGDHGRCEVCGTTIAPERLDVLPTTARCRGCAGSA